VGLRRRIEEASAAKNVHVQPQTPREMVRRKARASLKRYREAGSVNGPWPAARIEAWIHASDEELDEVLERLDGYPTEDGRTEPSVEDDPRYYLLREVMLARVSEEASRYSYRAPRCHLWRALDRLGRQLNEAGYDPSIWTSNAAWYAAASTVSNAATNRRHALLLGVEPITDAGEAERRVAEIRAVGVFPFVEGRYKSAVLPLIDWPGLSERGRHLPQLAAGSRRAGGPRRPPAGG
jgi:hypothetical protein